MSRIKSLDALKGFAIFAIVCLHVPSDATWPWEVFQQVCRFAVPCFFMVAGYLFHRAFHTNPDPKKLIVNYAIRLLKLFLFWALFYAIVPPSIDDESISEHLFKIVRYPHSFLMKGYVYHLWFLSSLIQAAIIVWTCLRFDRLNLALLIGGGLYFLALSGGPYAQTAWGFTTHFDMKNGPLVSTLFFALGAWFNTRQWRSTLPSGVLFMVAGLALHLTECFALNRAYGRPLTDNSYLIGTILYSMGIMQVALARPNFESVANQFGIASLGIFVLHPYVIVVMSRLPFNSMLFRIPILTAIGVLLVAYVATKLLSRVPWFKSFVS